MAGIGAQLSLAAALVLVAFLRPETLGELAQFFGTLAVTLTGGSAVGSGSMALRDYGSGGLTSSQGDLVLESQREHL